MLVGQPGTAKSHIAKALTLAAVEHGYRVIYREATTSSAKSLRPGNSAKAKSIAPV